MSKMADLTSSVRYAKGVGEKRAQLFKKLNIKTVSDLLYHFPAYYEDRSNVISIGQTSPGKRQVIQGKIILVDQFKIAKNLFILKAAIRDDTGVIYAIWYNQNYLGQLIKKGKELVVSGKVEWKFAQKQIKVEDFEFLSGDQKDNLHLRRIVPCYPLTEGLSQRVLRRIVKTNLEEKSFHLTDSLPDEIRKRYSFISLPEALNNIHFPENFLRQKEARRRLVFEELFLLQSALALKREEHKRESGIPFFSQGELTKSLFHCLPYSLTLSQKKVIREILEDMRSFHPMNRLLQGDVGSGKTIVATLVLLTAIANGYQTALMAPTEILAQQHWLNLRQLLTPLNIKLALLVSDLPSSEKREIRAGLKEGRIQLVIGTHTLIQKEIDFNKLGAVVIDEQHRFGVMQRLSLRSKGKSPDVLVMTATPIPRTLALTSYGDLDISVIDELPPGRKAVITRWISGRKREELYRFIREKLKVGRQAFFVYPLIEESEELDLKSAQEAADRLQSQIFPHFKVCLLHGRMRREEKERIMDSFRGKRIHVLASTTVIEVGIDIPNASLMLIENAERFGLAQLHQLRGRIGRGARQSYCFLLSGERISQQARERIKIMCKVNDGFCIAEEDLKLRGPGEFFGTKQWGMLNLKIADLIKDTQMFHLARKEAFQLVKKDPKLKNHCQLWKEIDRRFIQQMELVEVG